MRLKTKYFLIAASAALLLSVAACRGQSPGTSGYIPAGTSLPAASGFGDMASKSPIKSTCGDHVHIVLLGFVDCRFDEKGYGGKFKVYNHTKGLVGITPSSGTKATTFTVSGLLIGKGSFLVRDHRGHHLVIKVAVTTL